MEMSVYQRDIKTQCTIHIAKQSIFRQVSVEKRVTSLYVGDDDDDDDE